MKINGSSALVTGASRGLGRRMLAELLARGARWVYAAAPAAASLADAAAADRGRVVPLTLGCSTRSRSQVKDGLLKAFVRDSRLITGQPQYSVGRSPSS